MAVKKKSKVKKMFSPQATPAPAVESVDDDELMDELLAQLDSKHDAVRHESATVLNTMNLDEVANELDNAPKKDAKSRFRARKARKAAALAEGYAPTDAEADARLHRQQKEEEASIKRTCEELGLQMHEINPDGHCLFSAVADQLAILAMLHETEASYETCRKAAADFMQTHPDDFLPFLPSEGEDGGDSGIMSPEEFRKYCEDIRSTGVWGGEPEILALSRAYRVPIRVVQGGVPPVVVHGEEFTTPDTKQVVYISYHRHLYGLGEHYNSLRPRTLIGSIKSALHV